jgi:radical SAM/Cys-rich protein
LERQGEFPAFQAVLQQHGISRLAAERIDILQVNLGKRCNMTCRHCHVDAGPDRKEMMSRETVDACLRVIEAAGIKTLDLTGGAPEMNPHFTTFVATARSLGVQVIDRCNLTILLANGFKEVAGFLADQQVEIVASLPCYLAENADAQRGDGSFEKSIVALRLLNSLGYGRDDPRHILTLVYNPIGASLPPDQKQLEAAYREELARRYDVYFDRLFAITNMPISRYLEYLIETGEYESYMSKLIESFNPAAAAGVMCRSMISVGWDGTLYDCDFNQMLELPTSPGQPNHIKNFDRKLLSQRPITTGRHCFGCTAAAGSGCLGAIDFKE